MKSNKKLKIAELKWMTFNFIVFYRYIMLSLTIYCWLKLELELWKWKQLNYLLKFSFHALIDAEY